MKVITITNQKGGTAKTATAQTVAAGLQMQGRKVLLVDLDPQCNLTFDTGADMFGGLNIYNVLINGATVAANIQTVGQGVDLLGAIPELSGADVLIKGNNSHYRLKRALQAVANKYDYVIIDTPPTLGTLTVQALAATDGVIVTSLADPNSVLGVGLLNDTIKGIKVRCNSNLELLGILIAKYDRRTILARTMRDNLENAADRAGTVLFNPPIRNCIAVSEAQAMRQDLFSYAPRCKAAQDYKKVIEYIISYYEK